MFLDICFPFFVCLKLASEVNRGKRTKLNGYRFPFLQQVSTEFSKLSTNKVTIDLLKTEVTCLPVSPFQVFCHYVYLFFFNIW